MPHRSHDYRHLVERWRVVARRAGVPLRKLAEADGLPLYALMTPGLGKAESRDGGKLMVDGGRRAEIGVAGLRSGGGVYISAGIHGDEPASTEGLITWAEKQGPGALAKLPLLLLPCLNPWGLVNNRRSDASNVDLNRSFHLEGSLPVIRAVKDLVARHSRRRGLFAAALLLHEDYDGQGIYLYEIQKPRCGGLHWGEALLAAGCEGSGLPIDPRLRVDGRKVLKGIHRRRLDHRRFAKIGYPEAIWLHLEHAERTFTVETPSEFALEQRVAAHVAMIEEVVARAGGGS